MPEAQRILQSLPEALDEIIAALQVAEQTVSVLYDEAGLDGNRDDQQLRLEHGRVPAPLMSVGIALTGLLQKLVSAFARLEKILEERWMMITRAWIKSEVETSHINIGGMLSRAEGALALWQEYAVSGEGESAAKSPLDHVAQHSGACGL
jgi:ATP-dependent DNA helicase DinG